ncbi:MAG: glycosyltransferase family 2 protein, partial [Vicinamibacterales bacterium]
ELPQPTAPFPMTDRLTIMIAARNAAATIERAVRSCAGESRVPLLLIDDHSTDDTVARARMASVGNLRVVPAPDPGGVPIARQAGLNAVETEFATWLDADDEWVPGRMPGMIAALEDGCDVVVDSFDLHDGATGAWLRRLAAPPFLQVPNGCLRLFERNFLPGDSPVGFRVAAFREAGGYDAAVYGPESYDLLLRTIARGARFAWHETVGYRIYAYPGSVSRNMTRQRAALAAALRKHSYDTVRALYARAGYASRIAAWALVSMALFREEPDAALRFLEEASPTDTDPNEVLELEGPWPFREDWRRWFTRGVALLLLGDRDTEALDACRRAEAIEPTAEGANNLGVALARTGRVDEAREAWAIADTRFPGYSDPKQNNAADRPLAITTHPLRRHSSRTDYAQS